jgi:hypothetical protein
MGLLQENGKYKRRLLSDQAGIVRGVEVVERSWLDNETDFAGRACIAGEVVQHRDIEENVLVQ